MELVIEDSPSEDENDLLQQIGADNARRVLQYLEKPADLVRMAAVSRFWRHFVAESQCSRELCIKLFPEVSRLVCAFEIGQQVNSEGASLSKVTGWKNLEREHRVYTRLARDLMGPTIENNCIQHPISASSTDIFPDESIMYTLHPSAMEDDRPSYWSSQGESNSDVPETLTYRLSSRLCVVHEVKIHPFQAYFQMGYPIYSAKAVRIRLGRTRSSTLLTSGMLDGMMSGDRSTSEDYVWTYISPEFPMQQEDKLQTFRLPKPVLCIGGILQIELLGRVQKQEMDGLYYICVCHARVVGRPLPAAYDFAWGQMSFWGATVITSLASAIPVVGDTIVTWLWGGFSVDNATLNRFFSLHYLLPFILVGASLLHLAALHQYGSNNPLGVHSKMDKIAFYPYFYVKDLVGWVAFAIFFSIWIFCAPNVLGHPDNYIPANPMATPPHIVPEWYFLPIYAILRSIPDKLGGVAAIALVFLSLLALPFMKSSYVRSSSFRPIYQKLFWFFLADCLLLGWIGCEPVEAPYVTIGQISSVAFFLFFALTPILGRVGKRMTDYYTNHLQFEGIDRTISSSHY